MMMGERILLSLSRNPRANDYQPSEAEPTIDGALNLLERVCPDFGNLVRGKRIADFGCGAGNQSIAIALKFDCSVVGIDSNDRTRARAIENARRYPLPEGKVSFVAKVSPEMLGGFDIVISQNSFEHFDDPGEVLQQMRSLLKDSGTILLTFGPPWFAPYGSHMHFFCKVPWINVFFSEETVMKVRSRFRSDGAMRYEDVESGLNKMTVARFESIVASCNLVLEHKKYECVKGMNWLSRIPFLREFFINHITAILARA